MYIQILVLILFMILDISSSQSDPCTEYTETLREEQRSVLNIYNYTAEIALKDDRLTKQWYRIEISVGDRMTTYPPELFRCGTWYPIWLAGTLPSQPGEQVTRTVCQKSFTADCDRSWNIQIRYCCNDYYVYELEPSPVTDSAYCFGDNLPSTTTTRYFPECFSTTEVTSTSATISTESSPSTSFPSSGPSLTSSPSTAFNISTSNSFTTSTSSTSTDFTTSTSNCFTTSTTSSTSTNSPSTSYPSTSSTSSSTSSTSTNIDGSDKCYE